MCGAREMSRGAEKEVPMVCCDAEYTSTRYRKSSPVAQLGGLAPARPIKELGINSISRCLHHKKQYRNETKANMKD